MLKGQAKGPRTPERFQELVRPHIESYDYFITEGIQVVLEKLEPIEVCLKPIQHVTYVQALGS